MTSMSISEFNRNISKALKMAEDGDDVVLTRRGKEVLRVSRHGLGEMIEQEASRKAALAELFEIMDESQYAGGPASYDERTGRDLGASAA